MKKNKIKTDKWQINMLEFAEFFMEKFNYKNIKGFIHVMTKWWLVEEDIEVFEKNLREELRSHIDNVSRPLVRWIKWFIKEMSVGWDVIKLMNNLDPNTMILQDGLFNVKTNIFKRHTNKTLWLLKSVLPYSFVDIKKTQEEPRTFLKALHDIFEWQEKDIWHNIDFIQEFMGLLLIPNTKLEKALFIYWSWGNGKWVLVEAIKSMLWVFNCSNIWIAELWDKQFRYRIFGKLVNIDSDLFVDMILDREYVKKIVSWEQITIKRLYQQPFEIKPFSRLVVLSNEMPRTRLLNDAISRRFFFLHFKNFFWENADIELKEKIGKESKQIFFRAFQWLKRLMSNWWSFTLPNQIQKNGAEFIKKI